MHAFEPYTKLGGYNGTYYSIPVILKHGFFDNAIHDIAVTSVAVSQNIVKIGELVLINVTVTNEGNCRETFNVTITYDTTVIDTKKNITLPAKNSATIDFEWNVTNVPFGSYNITASAPVTGDVDSTDNTMTSEWQIEIIPEFPTGTSLLLVLIVLTFSIVIYKRRLLKTPNQYVQA